jgi:NAD(P)-dependent dehydrogenase (short-subunit alcohol dehydrogenase family)
MRPYARNPINFKRSSTVSAPNFKLENQIVIVTGGGQGIGFEIAQAMRASGAYLIIAEANQTSGEQAAQSLEGDFIQTDVTNSGSVKSMVSEVVKKHGRIDCIVNNAGICRNTPSEDVSDDEWRLVMSVDLDGVFYCCREVGKHMLERGAGSIVNIGSMSGIISNHPQPQSAYNAAKAGVIHLTKSLAGEWAARGVRVNSISPGYIGTAMTKAALENPEWRDIWLSSTPMGRLGEPAEVAAIAVFLASPASSFMTGSDVVVDGGYTSW